MSGNPPAGYYADPSIPGYIRYWDGTVWVPGTSRPAPQETAAGAAGGTASAVEADASSAAQPWRAEPGPEASREAAAAQSAVQQAVSGQGRQAVPQAVAAQGQQAQQAASAQAVPAQAQQAASAQAQQAVQQQPQQMAAAQGQQAVPAQFGQQYLPRQYSGPAADPSFPQETQVIPQLFAQPQQFPVPARPQIPQQYQPSAAQPEPEPEPQRPETIVGLVVPSAFAVRGGTGAYAYGGPANPFAGLPGAGDGGAVRPRSAEEGETTVLELATPGSRLLARIIDLGIATVFSAPITVSLLLIAHRHDHQYVLKLDAQATTTYTALGMDATGIALWGGAAAALLLVAILYEGYRLARGGQTAGKRLAGIRVVRLADASPVRGGGLGLRRALLFWVLAVLPLIDVLALGGVLWGRPYRQGLHERATSTATVRA